MTQPSRVREFSRTALALAILSAFAATAAAQDKKDEEKKSPIETELTVEAGAAIQSGDERERAFWGQYNGLRFQDAVGIFNFGYSRRDVATGSLLDVYGTNLGLQTRELGAFWTRQGEWRLNANYGELWRVNPYTVNTAITGGDTTPTANYLFGGPGSGGDTYPSTKRRALQLGGSKAFGSTWLVEGSVTTEKKEGSELFGIGNQCPGATTSPCSFTPGTTAGFGVLYMPKPIDQNHTQAELRLNWAGSALQLSGGYYGSYFTNDKSSFTPGIPGVLNNAVGQPLPAGPGVQAYLGQPVALAPENNFNQFDLMGSYTYSPMLRGNFKLAYGRSTQDQEFSSMGLTGAPAGISNLDGEVTHTLAQFRVIGNPMPNLSVVGEYRYTNQDDDTSIIPYSQVGTLIYTNQRAHREVNFGRIEATYRFPHGFQGTAGWNYEQIDRGSYTPTASYAGVSAMREETEENTWFLEARRNMSETISGLLRYSWSSRDGSSWLAPGAGGVGLVAVGDPFAQLGSNAIYIPTLADRDRNKLRLLLTWAATNALSVQFAVDVGRDDYDTPSGFALQETKFDLYTLDVNYALSDAWNVNGYLSTGTQEINQARPQGYVLGFEDKSFNVGIGFNGKPSEKLKLGGMLSLINNEDSYTQGLVPDAAPGSAQLLAVTGGLPDITYRRTELRLFGTYAYTARSSVRFDAAYQKVKYDDWSFYYGGVPFLYSDNTTVNLQQDQNVGYLGLSYVYSWR
jgi:MtrB/PioB family decaheme-associated outer membrane protein